MSRSRVRWVAGLSLAALLGAGAYLVMSRGGAGEVSSSAPAEHRLPPGERVRVEVLNAAGVPGIARDATRRLRDGGFDVVYFGNAPTFAIDSSLVVERAGGAEGARRVARALEIDRVESRPDTSLYLEVTVILGRDWRGIRSGESGDDEPLP
jgi:hypothetical protein